MPKRRFRVELTRTQTVEIEVNDPDVFERITGPGGDEWRTHLYDSVRTEEDVLHMFADNCARNGVERARQLDGWGDLPAEAATMRVVDAGWSEIDRVEETTNTK